MNHPISLLQELPYPLMEPGNPQTRTLMRMRLVPPSNANYLEGKLSDAHLNQSKNQLINLAEITRTSGEQQIIAQEHHLKQVYRTVFCSPETTFTPLLKVQAILMAEKNNLPENMKISRETAAWVWGYLSGTPTYLHLDFDKEQRVSRSAAGRDHFVMHQVRFTGFDYVEFATLTIATPRKIALDLLTAHPRKISLEHHELLKLLILDGDSNGCTLGTLKYIVKETKYLRFRERALACLAAIEKDLTTQTKPAASST